MEDLSLITKKSFEEYTLERIIDRFNVSSKSCALGILTKTSKRCLDTLEFDNIIKKSKESAYEKHFGFKVDYLLEQNYGDAWLRKINSIVRSNNK